MVELSERITSSPDIVFGKPAIRGTRYSVVWLLELLDAGMSRKDILADYKDLELADIDAVLAYAAK
ncbi:MAG TPA: DUF433 domain-containing protein [Roseiflexaceae bacterium]|nr:DUF433 domain-containing protein [Roseiflexaceae bacterium]